MGATLIEQFVARVLVGDDCWEWQGARTPTGYGLISRRVGHGSGVTSIGAHRLSWELLRGPIPEGLTIDHLCFNRACVRPSHLEPVTQAVNVERAVARRLASRSAAPPPMPVGVHAGGKGRGHQCGYEASYMAGCRCESCTEAHRVGARRRREAKGAA